MASSKVSPRIDVTLGKRIMKLKGSQVRGLSSFITVFRACWRDQSIDDSTPRGIATNRRFLKTARTEILKLLRASAKNLKHYDHDPNALFTSLGHPTPAQFAKLDDERLSSEVLRLCTSFKRRAELKSTIPIFGLKLYAREIADYRKYVARGEARLATIPARARARVKRFDAALAKFRVAATNAGLKIPGL